MSNFVFILKYHIVYSLFNMKHRNLSRILKAISPVYTNRLTLLALLIIVYSLIVYFLFPSKFTLKPGNFFSIALIAITAWGILGLFILLLPKSLRVILELLIALITGLMFLTGIGLFKYFHQFISSGLITFLRQQPVYFKTYVKQALHQPLLMLAWVIISLTVFFLIHSKNPRLALNKTQKITLFLLAFSAIIGISVSKHEYQRSFIPADLHFYYSLKYGLSDAGDLKPLQHMVSNDSIIIPNHLAKDTTRYNIVLIVFESLSRVPLSFYGYDNPYTPFLHDWISREKDRFVLMQKSMSVSGATDAIMPAIYTGVGPEQPYGKLITAPFMWDYAKLRGYTTIIASSQSQEWKNFQNFIRDENLDYYYHPSKLNLKLVNDVGADDLSVLDTVGRVLLRIPSPFFFYYNTNATHAPYQQDSPHIKDFHGIKDRYGRALFITDRIVKKIYEVIKQRGELDKTFFIFIADHGDYTAKRRQRLSSFYLETLDIPLMIRVPEQWIRTHPEAFRRLQQNIRVRTTSLDIAPTVYQILYDTLPNAYAQRFFEGKSLFDSIPPDRTIIALSTNDTRHYDAEGFGIYKGNESFLYHDHQGFEYYDLATDSLQQHNLINRLASGKRHFFDSIYQNNPYMLRIVRKDGK